MKRRPRVLRGTAWKSASGLLALFVAFGFYIRVGPERFRDGGVQGAKRRGARLQRSQPHPAGRQALDDLH